MKKIIFTSLVMTLSALSLVSCKKESLDVEGPKIKLVAPAEDAVLKPGSEVHFEVEFADNEALGSYKVNIHDAAGHTHQHATTRAPQDVVAFEKTWQESEFVKAGQEAIAGKKNAHVHHHLIKIPADIDGKKLKEGHYHFGVFCTDKAGNETKLWSEIVISYSGEAHDHEHEH